MLCFHHANKHVSHATCPNSLAASENTWNFVTPCRKIWPHIPSHDAKLLTVYTVEDITHIKDVKSTQPERIILAQPSNPFSLSLSLSFLSNSSAR